MENNEWMTIKEAAEVRGVPYKTAWYWVANNESIKRRKSAGVTLVYLPSFLEYTPGKPGRR